MIKKILAAFMVFALVLSPVGDHVFQQETSEVSAKGYKSGKKSFSPTSPSKNDSNSFFQKNKQDDNKTTNSAKTKQASNKGGILKGLFLGGLAGLLLGGLLSNLGILGSIIGLAINLLAIFVLIAVIRKIFVFFKNKRKLEEENAWRR